MDESNEVRGETELTPIEERSAVSGTTTTSAGLAGKAILVAESDPAQRESLLRQLQTDGFSVNAVAHGSELLPSLRGRRFDVVLCDLDLEGIEVLDLTAILENEFGAARPPLVLMLPADAPDPESALSGLGVAAWIQKPVGAPQLRQLLSTLFGVDNPAVSRLAPSAKRPTGRGHILVVDDNPANRMLAADMLTLLGYSADVASTGREAVEAMEHDQYAAVLMDCAMPDMDGYDATREIRRREAQRGTHTPIIAVTAYAMAGNRERCLAAGMDDFVTKPATRMVLNEVLARWTGRAVTQPQSAPVAPVAAREGVVLDREFLLNQVNGDIQLLERVVGLYIGDIQGAHQKINAALSARDADGLKKAAHTLKGSAANLGARRTSEIAHTIEDAGRDRRWDDARASQKVLEQELHQLLKLLEEELRSIARSAPAAGSEPPAPPAALVDDSRLTILLIDDQPIIGESIRQTLTTEADIDFHYCADPSQALSTAIALSPTTILVDLVMPNVNGLDLVAQFRAHASLRFVPLIVLSMKEDPTIKAEAFRCGANDYLVKLPSAIELVARVRYHSQAYLTANRSRAAHEALRESRAQLQARNDEIQKQRDTLARQAEELTEKIQELGKANSVKTYFAATMSHELRNVFTAIVGYGDVLTDKLARTEPLGPQDGILIEQLRGRGREGLDIINATLELSRSEVSGSANDLQTIVLSKLLEELCTGLPDVHKKTDVAVTSYTELSSLRSDPIKLRMILTNLITNALKFTPAGGSIEVRAVVRGDDVEITVSDTGSGIPSEALPTLFEPFKQAHGEHSRRAGGAGLGLYLVRKLVGMLEGSIDVQSEVGKGSTFRISLPNANKRDDSAPRAAVASQPATGPTTPPVDAAQVRVLVAEDVPANQVLMKEMMARLGYTCRIVSNGQEAINALSKDRYDIVLMDVSMPIMDGIEAAHEIMKRFAELDRPKIIALTAGGSAEERRECQAAGMVGFVGKPFTMSTLRTAIEGARNKE